MPKVARNKFLIEVNDQFVRPNIKGLDFIDTDFNPKVLATKTGRIYCLPISIGQEFRYDIKLEIGDEVVFNHLVCNNRNKFSDTIFFGNYNLIFAVIRDGVLIPLEDAMFLEKIIEVGDVIGGFKIPDKVSSKCATIYAASTYAQSEGIRNGDVIFFTKDADYPIAIGGKEFYKMHLRNVIGIDRGGELTTFRNKLLVKDITELGKIGGLEKIYANTSLRTGIVMESGTTGIAQGTLLTYYNGTASIVNWKGSDYAFINLENIKYLL